MKIRTMRNEARTGFGTCSFRPLAVATNAMAFPCATPSSIKREIVFDDLHKFIDRPF